MATSDPIQLRVQESSQVGDARRQAVALAGALGLDETRRGEVAIVATELANNLVRHARDGGELIIRSLAQPRNVDGGADSAGMRGIEFLSIDHGPGIPHLGNALRDGYSTGGTPGTGLGSVRRLSTEFDLYSAPSGTVLLSRLWAGELPDVPAALRDSFRFGVVSLPLRGEEACGDAWSLEVEAAEGRRLILVADGLGHGLSAADAARAAVRAFHENIRLDSVRRMEAIHAALRATRGAAVSVAELRLRRQQLAYIGVGNISAMIIRTGVAGESVRNLVSHNGTMGAEVRRIQEFVEPWPADGLLVMHSDGLASQWRLEKYPGLRQKHPALIAAVLYRDHRRERDDVTVLAVSTAPAGSAAGAPG